MSSGPSDAATLKIIQVKKIRGTNAREMKPMTISSRSKSIILYTQVTAQKAKNIFAFIG